MKKKFIFIGMVLLFAGIFISNAFSAPDGDKSSVWEISKGGKTLFLAGSIHILREQDLPLPPAFETAFNKSDILVLEADTGKMSEPEVVAYLQQQLLLPQGVTLRTILKPKIYKKLEKEFKSFGLPSLDAFSGFKPSMVMNILSMLYMQKYGFMEQGVDEYFLSKARGSGKRTAFLETVEVQIDVLLGIGEGYENDYVKYSLEDNKDTEAYLSETVAEWREGSAAATETMLKEMKREWPIIYKTMLSDRNNAWIPIIEGFFTTKPVEFIIVGLAHIHGPDGLLQYFQKTDYTIKPVAQ
jgi:uncharacterized protein YbaP (TraB family)